MEDNPIRHVVIALTLSLLVMVVAGDKWNSRINAFTPVKPAEKTP